MFYVKSYCVKILEYENHVVSSEKREKLEREKTTGRAIERDLNLSVGNDSKNALQSTRVL